MSAAVLMQWSTKSVVKLLPAQWAAAKRSPRLRVLRSMDGDGLALCLEEHLNGQMHVIVHHVTGKDMAMAHGGWRRHVAIELRLMRRLMRMSKA